MTPPVTPEPPKKSLMQLTVEAIVARHQRLGDRWSKWHENALAYIKGDRRPKPWINNNGMILAPRVPTHEDVERDIDPRLYHGPKVKWKAPYLTGMANPHIRKASQNKYSPEHALRKAKG
jgi:hypothetical protein